MFMRKLERRAAGINLVETLVVLVILGRTLSLVGPSLGNTYDNWLVQLTGRRAAALFRFAEATARRNAADVACYLHDQTLILSRGQSVLRKLEIPGSITMQPHEPKGAFFLATGQIVASEDFVLQNRRGRKVVIEFGPM